MKKIILFVILIYGFANSQIQEINGSVNMTGGVEFTGSIQVPNATEDDEAVNKGQLDATVGNYVPITGSELGKPITNRLNFTDISDSETFHIGLDGNSTETGIYFDNSTNQSVVAPLENQVIVIGTSDSFSGVNYNDDYSANYTDRSLVDKGSVGQIVVDYLKELPTYNASTPQVLGHDASGNIQWQAP